MIRQLLDSQYLVQSRIEMQRALSIQIAKAEQKDSQTLRALDDDGVSLDDLRDAIAQLDAEDTQKAIAEDESAATLPRDAAASLLQSSLESFYKERNPDLLEHSLPEGAFATQAPVTDISLTLAAAQISPEKLFEKMSQTDIRWASVGFAKMIGLLRQKHGFPEAPAASLKIANNARVILVGDWGSGVPRSRLVGQRMRDILTDSAFKSVEQHVIHLGDVYYSGFANEYKNNFLAYWPVHSGEESRYGSWCLNGNHDMYSGGHGYFDFLLRDCRFARQQQSSHFLLETDYWQIFALDTAWDDAGLAGQQSKWVSDTRRANPHKKGILLSHHQPFSAYEPTSTKIQGELDTYHVLAEGLVHCWFWGHEHRCALYECRDGIRYPRLIGHGGVPVWATLGPPPPTVAYHYDEYLASGLEKFARFGFAVLDFSSSVIKVQYINELGVLYKDEVLQ